MMLQFSCILELVAAWAFKVGIVGMLYLNMAILHIRIFKRLITSWALYRNVVVPVAMLLQLRNSSERICGAEVALELLSMRLHVLLQSCLGLEPLIALPTGKRPAGLSVLFTFCFT